MNKRQYIQERMFFLGINISLASMVVFVMVISGVPLKVAGFVLVIWFLPLLSYMAQQYMVYKRYYDGVEKIFETLDVKYLLPQVIEEPSFIEGKIFYNLLKKTNKAMHEQVNAYERQQKEYKEYIEQWIHEIKTPIAAIHLLAQNSKGYPVNKIIEEVRGIERFVEQVLYYARSNDVYKDYMIKPFTLRKAVMEAVMSHSRLMMQKGIVPELNNLEETVYSDYKWIVFILGQIITNSVKYTQREKSVLKITSLKQQHKVVLTLQDEGIGIRPNDLERVFDKGFTGENGRKLIGGTGIGLYLCKKLCDKLNIGIQIKSKLNEGTMVALIFPLLSYDNVTETLE